jgi:hypothetical protein
MGWSKVQEHWQRNAWPGCHVAVSAQIRRRCHSVLWPISWRRTYLRYSICNYNTEVSFPQVPRYLSRRGHLSRQRHTILLESPGVVDQVERMRSEMRWNFPDCYLPISCSIQGMSVAMRWDDEIMQRQRLCASLQFRRPTCRKQVSCHPLMELTVSRCKRKWTKSDGILSPLRCDTCLGCRLLSSKWLPSMCISVE